MSRLGRVRPATVSRRAARRRNQRRAPLRIRLSRRRTAHGRRQRQAAQHRGHPHSAPPAPAALSHPDQPAAASPHVPARRRSPRDRIMPDRRLPIRQTVRRPPALAARVPARPLLLAPRRRLAARPGGAAAPIEAGKGSRGRHKAKTGPAGRADDLAIQAVAVRPMPAHDLRRWPLLLRQSNRQSQPRSKSHRLLRCVIWRS